MVAGVRCQQMAPQARLIEALNPVIRGGSHPFAPICRHEAYEQLDEQRRPHLRSWSRVRPPQKRQQWGDQTFWRGTHGRRHCRPRARGTRWRFHTETPIQRHSNVHGRRSPDDGDAVYGGRRRVPLPASRRESHDS